MLSPEHRESPGPARAVRAFALAVGPCCFGSQLGNLAGASPRSPPPEPLGDSPESRPVQNLQAGRIIQIREVGGLHDRSERRAAQLRGAAIPIDCRLFLFELAPAPFVLY